MKKITPFLWFDNKAQEAANFYVSVFKHARILDGGGPTEELAGSQETVLSVTFELEGQEFIALNGCPHYAFTPAVSFSIDCATQEEVDTLWERLSEGGEPGRCGWLQDKYGLSWQIVPSLLSRLLQDDNENKSDAVMQAMLKMTKLEISTLQAAYDAALFGQRSAQTNLRTEYRCSACRFRVSNGFIKLFLYGILGYSTLFTLLRFCLV